MGRDGGLAPLAFRDLTRPIAAVVRWQPAGPATGEATLVLGAMRAQLRVGSQPPVQAAAQGRDNARAQAGRGTRALRP